MPGINTADYISVCQLVSHGTHNGKPICEQIFVHAKLLISDDRYAVIGSNNMNDRNILVITAAPTVIMTNMIDCHWGSNNH